MGNIATRVIGVRTGLTKIAATKYTLIFPTHARIDGYYIVTATFRCYGGGSYPGTVGFTNSTYNVDRIAAGGTCSYEYGYVNIAYSTIITSSDYTCYILNETGSSTFEIIYSIHQIGENIY